MDSWRLRLPPVLECRSALASSRRWVVRREDAIQRREDHRAAQGGRSGHAGNGTVPQARLLGSELLSVAQRSRRYGVGMIHPKLRQAGEVVNFKRVERL